MKIYYSSSLWGKGKGFCGLPQSTNWEFEYAGNKRVIPTIYRFRNGIVFDVITILAEAELRQYFEKYEAMAETMTSLQRRCAEQEHPFQSLVVKEIWINGQRAGDGYSSSSSVSIPWARQENHLTDVRKAYSSLLQDTTCFACQRFCVPYPKADTFTQRLRRLFCVDCVKNLKLSAHSTQRFSPLDISFEMSDEDNNKEVSFKHPVTGDMHTLYFRDAEFVEMPLGKDADQRLCATQAVYEIEPALPNGDTLLFDSSIQTTKPMGSPRLADKTGAGAIGIIGGADGPTAIFCAGGEQDNAPEGEHELPLHCCFSVPTLDSEDTSRFVLEGINIKAYDSEEWLLE